MMLKRLAVATFVVAMAVVPSAHAQDVPNDPTCTPAHITNHITGEACQGPDIAPAEDKCVIEVWVQKATCELAVPGGVTKSISVAWANASESGDPVSHHIVIRAADGTVLHERSREGGGPAGPRGLLPWNSDSGSVGATVANISTDTVICEITGTHTVFGAADIRGIWGRNSFNCKVNI